MKYPSKKSNSNNRIRIPFPTALTMAVRYVRSRIAAQIRAVTFIILYLIVFQVFVLGATIPSALTIAAGIALVVVGLAFFLEGLILGLMPLGERVGVVLPARAGLAVIVGFGVLIGVGATLAEPAIAALQRTGAGVIAWESPLLFSVLEYHPETLAMAIAAGVGGAVALGMIRFFFGLSLRAFVITVIPLALLLSGFMALDPVYRSIVGIAWDAGAVTTGAVTVPLILALGIGVSRATGTRGSAGNGYGLIMLASAVPILAVLLFGWYLGRTMPEPMPETQFFSPAAREEVLPLFPNEETLFRHAWTHGTEAGRRALYGEDQEVYLQSLRDLGTNPIRRRELIGALPLTRWRETVASDEELRVVGTPRSPAVATPGVDAGDAVVGGAGIGDVLREEWRSATRAVIPLTGLLLVVLVIFLREIPPYRDEILLGIVVVLLGMTMLTAGIRVGLVPLGDEVGRRLPRAFRSAPEETERIVIEGFDLDLVSDSITPAGERRRIFYLKTTDGMEIVDFVDSRFDHDERVYEHIRFRPPLFGPNLTHAGIALVLLFAFGLGFGSTLAEPALRTLGRSAETVTVGSIKQTAVVRIVSIGVGLGLVAGMVRILFDVPTFWMILPPYVLVVVLTFWNEEDFAGIAWDSGGVTTGVVTVPLVLAMGIGVGGALNVTDGFGVLAMASVYPVLTMLFFGFWKQRRQRRVVLAEEREEAHRA